MAEYVNDALDKNLPIFITAPGEADWLFICVVVFVVFLVLALGVIYLSLHSIPEGMVKKTNTTQFQLVAILALLALFTNEHIYWIAALLLATFQLPDYGAMLDSMTKSLSIIAANDSPTDLSQSPTTAPEGNVPADTSNGSGVKASAGEKG